MTNDVRRCVRALVEAVIAEREDARIVRPVVAAMVNGALHDFDRYYDSRHAANRVRDFDILMARNRAAKGMKEKP